MSEKKPQESLKILTVEHRIDLSNLTMKQFIIAGFLDAIIHEYGPISLPDASNIKPKEIKNNENS